MAIKANEITRIIKEQIKDYGTDVVVSEVGTVISAGDGIARIHGLEKVMSLELLEFPHDVYGMAFNLEESSVGAVLFGEFHAIGEGDLVKRTKRIVEVPVGDALLGRVVDSLGRPLDGKGPVETEQHNPVEALAPGVTGRQPVREPVQTGIKAIDSMIPIGRGQRELLIGDRQTGKSAIAIDTIINQKNTDLICIYVVIGQKRSTVAQVVKTLEDAGVLLSFGSDWPGTNASWYTSNPLHGMYAAVTRQTMDGQPEGGWFPEERISAESALKAYTVNNAWVAGEEDYKGRIKVGYLADLAVLEENPLEVEGSRLRDLRVLITMVDGKIVFERPAT